MVDKIKTASVTPPTHTADRDAEAISALMDGEANDLDLRRLLKFAAENPETMETWDARWKSWLWAFTRNF